MAQRQYTRTLYKSGKHQFEEVTMDIQEAALKAYILSLASNSTVQLQFGNKTQMEINPMSTLLN